MIISRARSNSQFVQPMILSMADMKAKPNQQESQNLQFGFQQQYIGQNSSNNIKQQQKQQAINVSNEKDQFNYYQNISGNKNIQNPQQEKSFRHKKSNSIDSFKLSGLAIPSSSSSQLNHIPQQQQFTNGQYNYVVAIPYNQNDNHTSSVGKQPSLYQGQQIYNQQLITQQYPPQQYQNQVIYGQTLQVPSAVNAQQYANSNRKASAQYIDLVTPKKQFSQENTSYSQSSLKQRSISEQSSSINNTHIVTTGRHRYPQKVLLNTSASKVSIHNTPQSQSPPQHTTRVLQQLGGTGIPQQQLQQQQHFQYNQQQQPNLIQRSNQILMNPQAKILNQSPPKIIYSKSLLNSKQNSNSKNLPPLPSHSPQRDFKSSYDKLNLTGLSQLIPTTSQTTQTPFMSTIRSRSLATEPFMNTSNIGMQNERLLTDVQSTSQSQLLSLIGQQNSNIQSNNSKKIAKLDLSQCNKQENQHFQMQSDRAVINNNNNNVFQQTHFFQPGALSDRSHLLQNEFQRNINNGALTQRDPRDRSSFQNLQQQNQFIQNPYKQQILQKQQMNIPQNNNQPIYKPNQQYFNQNKAAQPYLQQQQQQYQQQPYIQQHSDQKDNLQKQSQMQTFQNQFEKQNHHNIYQIEQSLNQTPNKQQLQQPTTQSIQRYNNLPKPPQQQQQNFQMASNLSLSRMQNQAQNENEIQTQINSARTLNYKTTQPTNFKQQNYPLIQQFQPNQIAQFVPLNVNQNNQINNKANQEDLISIKYKTIKQKLNNLTNLSNELLNKSHGDVNQKVEKMIQDQIAIRQREAVMQNSKPKDEEKIDEIKIIIEPSKKDSNRSSMKIKGIDVSIDGKSNQITINTSQERVPPKQKQQNKTDLQNSSRRSVQEHSLSEDNKVLQNLNLNNQDNQLKSLSSRIQNSLKKSEKNIQNSVQESHETFFKLGLQSIDGDILCNNFSKDVYSEAEYQSQIKNFVKNLKSENQPKNAPQNLQQQEKPPQEIVLKLSGRGEQKYETQEAREFQLSKRRGSYQNKNQDGQILELVDNFEGEKASNTQHSTLQNGYEYSQPISVQFKNMKVSKDRNQNEQDQVQGVTDSKDAFQNPENEEIKQLSSRQQQRRSSVQNESKINFNQGSVNSKNRSSTNEHEGRTNNSSAIQPEELQTTQQSFDPRLLLQTMPTNPNIQQQLAVLQLIHPSEKSEMIPYNIKTEASEHILYDEEHQQFHQQFAQEISSQLNNKFDQAKFVFTKNKSFNQPISLSSRVTAAEELPKNIKLKSEQSSSSAANQRYKNQDIDSQYSNQQDHLAPQQTQQTQQEKNFNENEAPSGNTTSRMESSVENHNNQIDNQQKKFGSDFNKVRDTFDMVTKKKSSTLQNKINGSKIQIQDFDDENEANLLQVQELQMMSPETILRMEQENENNNDKHRENYESDTNTEYTDISQIEQKITCENILLEDSIQKTRDLKNKLQRIRLETGIDVEKYVEKLYFNLGPQNSQSKDQLIQIIKQNMANNSNANKSEKDKNNNSSQNHLHFTPVSSINSQERFNQLNTQQYINSQNNSSLIRHNAEDHQTLPNTRNRYLSELLLQKQEQKIKEIEETESFQKRLMKRVQKKSSTNSSNTSSVMQSSQANQIADLIYYQNQLHLQDQNNQLFTQNVKLNQPHSQAFPHNLPMESPNLTDRCITQSFQSALTENQQIGIKEMTQQQFDPLQFPQQKITTSHLNPQNIQSKQTIIPKLNLTGTSYNDNNAVQYAQIIPGLQQNAREGKNNQIINERPQAEIEAMVAKIQAREDQSQVSSQYELSSEFSSHQNLQKQENGNNPINIHTNGVQESQKITFEAYYQLQQHFQHNQQQNQSQSEQLDDCIMQKQQINSPQILNQVGYNNKNFIRNQLSIESYELEKLSQQDLQLFTTQYLQNIHAQKKTFKKQYKNLKSSFKQELQLIQQNQNQNFSQEHTQLYTKIEFYLKDIKAKINYVELQKTDLDKKNFNCANSKDIIQNYLKYSQLIAKGIDKIVTAFLRVKEIQGKILQMSLNSTMNFNPMIDDLIQNNYLKSEQEWEEVFNQEQLLANAQEKNFFDMINKYNNKLEEK